MMFRHVFTQRRRRADEWLRASTDGVVPPAYASRAAQLTSRRERLLLADSLRRVAEGPARVGSLGGRYRPRHTVARSRRASLEVLATALEREDQFVTPAGMLRVRDLVTAGTGPLWGTSEQALDEAIETTLGMLMPQSGAQAESHAA
jgi:hypothetical protein